MKNTGLWNRVGNSLVVEIPVRHMNVTAKDIALINGTAYSQRYPLPFIFRQRTEKK